MHSSKAGLLADGRKTIALGDLRCNPYCCLLVKPHVGDTCLVHVEEMILGNVIDVRGELR